MTKKALSSFLLLCCFSIIKNTESKSIKDVMVERADSDATPRMLGLDTGNPAADFEAEMWIAALIGTLTAAIPVAFLNPSLGFRRRRRALDIGNFVPRHYFNNP